MSTTIRTTLADVLHSTRDWDGYCEEFGWSVWAVNEGGGHIEVTHTIEEAKRYGLV